MDECVQFSLPCLAETTRDSKGSGVSEGRFLERPIHKLVLLMSREEQDGR